MKYAIAFVFTTTTYLFMLLPDASENLPQTHKDSMDIITSVIRKEAIVTSPGVGYGQRASTSYYAYVYMTMIATNDELYLYTKDTSAALRVYSYYSLKYKNDKRETDAKKLLKEDSSTTKMFSGCLKSTVKVSELIKGEWNLYSKADLDRNIHKLEENPDSASQLFEELREGKVNRHY